MQETTYFVPEPKKIIITKKHFAVMLFAWWFLIQFFDFVINPSTKFVYETIFEEGIMNVYGKNRQKDSKQDESEKQNLQQGKHHNHKKHDKHQNSKNYKETNPQTKNHQNNENLEGINMKKVLNLQQKQVLKGMSKNQEFKIHFKIKGKGKTMQDLKQKATEQSLKMAMEGYLLKKKQQL